MFNGKVFAVSRSAAMKAFALSLLATAVVSWAPVAPAQVSVTFGWRLCALTDTLTMRPTTALRMGTTDRIGLWAEYFSEPYPGSTGLVDSLDTSTIAMTLTTVTTDQCLNAEPSSSTTSTGMRRGMDGVMKDRLRTARRGSMRCRGITVAAGILAGHH